MATSGVRMLGAAILLAALGILLARLWPDSTPELPTTTSRAPHDAPAPDPGVEPPAPASSPQQADPKPERVAATNLALCTLRVRACERGTGQPVASSRIATSRGDRETALAYWHAGSTDTNGELVLTDLAPGWLWIRASDGEDAAGTTLHQDAANEVVLTVEAPVSVTGRVVTRDGGPAGTAELWISDVNAEHEGDLRHARIGSGVPRVRTRGPEARRGGRGESDLEPHSRPG